MLIRKDKIPPCDQVVWFVEIYLALQVVLVVVIDNCMICGLITSCVICCLNDYAITWSVNCCAKCQFHPFLLFSSISMPPSWKMLPVTKTPENSTFPLIFKFCNNFVTFLVRNRTMLQKFRSIATIKSTDI